MIFTRVLGVALRAFFGICRNTERCCRNIQMNVVYMLYIYSAV